MISFHCEPFFRAEKETQRFLPEGPTQLVGPEGKRSTSLAWVSIQHAANSRTGSLNILDLETQKNKEFLLPSRPGFIAQTELLGQLYIGLENRIIVFDYLTKEWHWESSKIIAHPRTVINDGLAIDGGLIFGTKDLNFTDPIAHLYHFDSKSGALSTLRDGQTCSNGKFLVSKSQNEQYLFDIDTPKKSLVKYLFDEDEITLSNKELIIDFSDRSDFPDGMRLCPNRKSAIIAFYNPSNVDYGVAQQFCLASGEIEIEWRLPRSPRVTCPEFVIINDEVKVIFTTADEGMSAEQRQVHSEAGSLFIGDYPQNELPKSRPLLPLPA